MHQLLPDDVHLTLEEHKLFFVPPSVSSDSTVHTSGLDMNPPDMFLNALHMTQCK